MPLHNKGRYVVFASMSLLYFLLMAGTFNALGIVLPSMVRDLEMDWAEAGFGFTLLGVSCGLTSLVPAVLIRRFGVSRTLMSGTVLLASGFACMAVGQTALVYHAGTVLAGIGFCFCGTVPGVHVISKLFERQSVAIGAYFTIGNLGAVVGPLLFVGFESLMDQWRLFWLICTSGAALFGIFAVIATRGQGRGQGSAPGSPAVSDSNGWSAEAAMRTPQFWIVVGAYTTCLLINTTVHSFVVQHLREQGVPLAQSAGLLSAVALIGAVVSGLAGVIGQRVSSRVLTLFALGMLSIACAALILPGAPFRLSIFAVAMGLGFGASYVGTAVLLLDYFGRRANLELFATMCMVSTSAALGPVLGGLMRDQSGNFFVVFLAHAGVGGIVFALLACVKAPQRKAEGQPIASAGQAIPEIS